MIRDITDNPGMEGANILDTLLDRSKYEALLWTDEEEAKFKEALRRYGNCWKKV